MAAFAAEKNGPELILKPQQNKLTFKYLNLLPLSSPGQIMKNSEDPDLLLQLVHISDVSEHRLKCPLS